MPDLPGYEILEKVGEGAMAAVWTARQLSLDRVVAIKVLSPHLLRDEDAIRRFGLEAQSAAKLNHPGIVQIYDAGAAEGLVYLIMEFVAGCTVAELLERKRRLGEKHSLLIAEGVALALAYAWNEARLIHCDVKPANVLIDQDGSIKITDMGLAKVFGTNVPGSGREMLEGTPHYVSPEQARGEPDLDCRADIYSLGAMLYHMTTGRLPFGDSAEIEVVERQISDYLPDPQQINTDLSEGVAWLIEKMMVKDRTSRYQSWAEVLVDMEQVQHGDIPAARTLAAGHSTVLRSEIRSIAKPKPVPSPEVQEVAKKEPASLKPKAVIKQKIILPKDLREQVGVGRKPSGELARAVFALFLMGGAVLLAYGTLSYLSYRRAHPSADRDSVVRQVEASAQLPPRSYIPGAKKTAGGDATYWQSPAAEGETAVGSGAKSNGGQTIQWKHPAFLRGARLFNEALDKYKSYLADRSNPDILKTVEQQCRDAIAAFESCRAFAPPDVKIQDLINQGYRLISDCRQSTLMDSAKAGSKESAATSPLAMAAPASSTSQAAQAPGQLTLAPTWNNTQSGGDKILEDLRALLSGQGQAAMDLKPDATLILFGQVRYLMPLKEAVDILAKPASPRKSLNCPGFPKDSLYYYSVEGEFGNGFDKILLVTDSADRIAAVELVNEHPDESLWLDPAVFSENWHAYNFVQTRTKGSAKWRVGHRVETVNRVVRIDSELVANDEYGYFGLGDSKERVSLYLPQQLVNLILLRLEKLKEI
jgi:serine/threonine protein kinase